MDDQEAELRNPFPSPPAYYTRYTTQNLQLLATLKERERDGRAPGAETVRASYLITSEGPTVKRDITSDKGES